MEATTEARRYGGTEIGRGMIKIDFLFFPLRASVVGPSSQSTACARRSSSSTNSSAEM